MINMSKENKIVTYGYKDRAKELLDDGLSTYQIAKILNNEIGDKKAISHMSVQRFKDVIERDKIEDSIEEGEDPSDVIIEDFRNGIRENIKKVDKGIDIAMKLMEDAKDSDFATFSEKSKTVDTFIKALDQEKKSWTSLVQNGIRQMKVLGDVNIKKEQNVKVLLLNWTNKLCPECRKKLYNIIEEEELDG